MNILRDFSGVTNPKISLLYPTLLHCTDYSVSMSGCRSPKYFTAALQEPEVLQDAQCVEVVRRGEEYFQLSYEDKLHHWTRHDKPSRWPHLLAALSYAEVREEGRHRQPF